MYAATRIPEGRITQWRIGEPNHSIKVRCSTHKQCEIIRSAKRLPYGAENKIAEWLFLGKQRHPSKEDAIAHKNMFDATWLNVNVKVPSFVLTKWIQP